MYRRWWSRCRCTYSHIIVSLIQGFTRVSVDRTGPKDCSHELEHVELCIRLLNSPAGMTRKKFCFLMINQTKVKLAQDVLKAYKDELAALEKGGPLPVPEWLQARDDDDDDDVEDSHPQEEEEEEVDEEVDDEEEDDEDGDEVHEHQEDDDDSHSSADSDDSDDESFLPEDDEEEDDIDDVIDLVVEDDDVLAGYVAPQNIFTRLYNEVLQNWATATTNWISFFQMITGRRIWI